MGKISYRGTEIQLDKTTAVRVIERDETGAEFAARVFLSLYEAMHYVDSAVDQRVRA